MTITSMPTVQVSGGVSVTIAMTVLHVATDHMFIIAISMVYNIYQIWNLPYTVVIMVRIPLLGREFFEICAQGDCSYI